MKHLQSSIKELVLFSLPIIAGQIGQMLFGITDIAVGGRYSSEVVSALGVGNSLCSPFFVFGLGIAFQFGPMTAQRLKKGTLENGFYQSSLLINILLGSLLTFLFLIIPTFLLPLFNFPSHIIPLVKVYSYWIAPSILFSMLFQNDKEFLQAHDRTYFANACILFFNLVNLVLNIMLMFGKWGAPELGIVGTGISTFICRAGMTLSIHLYVRKLYGFKLLNLSTKYIKTIITEALPVSFGITSEVFMFSVSTILAASYGVLTSAAHNICLNIAATTFMVPLALSSSVSVKIGHSYGLEDLDQLRKYALSSIVLIIIFSLFTFTLYLSLPEQLVGLITDQKSVSVIAVSLMFYVALFQVPDAIQACLQGILRGISVTKPTMWITIISGGLSAIVSYYFSVVLNLEAKGLWIALGVVLTIQSICYFLLLKKKLKEVQMTWLKASDQKNLT